MLNDIINSCWSACVEKDPLGGENQRYSYFFFQLFNILSYSYSYFVNDRNFMADAIISNPVTYGHIHCAEALAVPLHLMFPQVLFFCY